MATLTITSLAHNYFLYDYKVNGVKKSYLGENQAHSSKYNCKVDVLLQNDKVPDHDVDDQMEPLETFDDDENRDGDENPLEKAQHLRGTRVWRTIAPKIGKSAKLKLVMVCEQFSVTKNS